METTYVFYSMNNLIVDNVHILTNSTKEKSTSIRSKMDETLRIFLGAVDSLDFEHGIGVGFRKVLNCVECIEFTAGGWPSSSILTIKHVQPYGA